MWSLNFELNVVCLYDIVGEKYYLAKSDWNKSNLGQQTYTVIIFIKYPKVESFWLSYMPWSYLVGNYDIYSMSDVLAFCPKYCCVVKHIWNRN